MNAATTLPPVFTPSAAKHETLEAIFVQREPLLKRLMANVRDSAVSGGAKSHALLVGPRGIGKTHLISLVYHRTQADTDLRKRVRIAWLREENWEVTSFLELMENILSALIDEYKDETLERGLVALGGKADQDTENRAVQTLLDYLGDSHTLLLLVENLDDLFESIGAEGQHSLRAFLENHRNAVLVATTQSLSPDLSDHDAPFYGFFNITHLKVLTLKQAKELLQKVADQNQDKELADYLRTPVADRRLQVVEDLAGGHPRIWILFAGCLDRPLLDELVPLFMKMLDNLTPYYQDRMRYLPTQQRKIVTFLTKRRGAVPVKEIAEACRLPSPQGAASQLHQLEEKGYVRVAREEGIVARSRGDRRASSYELREPLMRLCFEVKESRGKPIQLIVDFLRLWYDSFTLRTRLKSLSENAQIERQYIAAALESSISWLLERLHEDSEDTSRMSGYRLLIKRNDFVGLHEHLQKHIDHLEENGKQPSSWDWFVLGYCLQKLERYADASDAYKKAIQPNPKDSSSYHINGIVFQLFERYEDALTAYDESIQLRPEDADTYYNKANALFELHRQNEALEYYKKAIELVPEYIEAHLRIGNILFKLSRYEEALQAYDAAMQLSQPSPQVAIVGQALTESIPDLFSPDITDARARKWRDAWQERARGHDELEIPMRFLNAAVEWRETRDRRHLLTLAVEERRILERLLPQE